MSSAPTSGASTDPVARPAEGAGRCPACGTPSQGAYYCPTCGQRRGSGRVTLGEWLADFLDDTLSLDGTLPRSLGLLLTRPGFLTREWLAGRRSPYTRPFRLYLIASAVFFAAAFAVGTEGGGGGAVVIAPGHDPWDQVLFERWGAWFPTAMFFLVPFFALLLKGFFRGAGLYYIEHLILAFHLHAGAFLILAPIWVVEPLPEPWVSISQVPFLLWIVAYLFLTLRRAYGVGWAGAALKGIALLLVYLVGMLVATAAAAAAGVQLTQERPLREAHEHYFRYMDSVGAGAESTAMRERLAEAVRRYERVDPRIFDAHDHYHVGRLELERGRPVAAWNEALSALRQDSTALLALGLAVRASWDLGAEEEARSRAASFLRLLDLETEREDGLSGRHVPELLEYRGLARRIAGEGTDPQPGSGEGRAGLPP